MCKKIINQLLINEYKLFKQENDRFIDINVTSGSNLIIHPDDSTTDFLKPSYAGLDATVLTTHRDMFNLKENMKNHDRIIMMGHGTPSGLLMPGITIQGVELINNKLNRYNEYILGSSFVNILKTKPIVAVWCNADRFVLRYDLHGFYTGMVISELCEANYCKVNMCDQYDLDESNYLFTEALTAAIKIPSAESVNVFKEIYDNPNNTIMVYNRKRIYYR